jgi:hypothetical protein
MILLTDGTPLPFTRNSMYGPDGATAPLAGKVTVRPPVAGEKLNGTRRVPASNA